jgi:hypothetical protein
MEEASRKRYREAFTQDKILTAYEELLLQFVPAASVESRAACAPQSIA